MRGGGGGGGGGGYAAERIAGVKTQIEKLVQKPQTSENPPDNVDPVDIWAQLFKASLA